MLHRGRPLRGRGRVTREAVRGSFHTGLSFTVYWNLSVIAQLPLRHHVIRIKSETFPYCGCALYNKLLKFLRTET